MAQLPKISSQHRQARLVGFLFFCVLLLGGVYLGTDSTLRLQRDAAGTVTAVNEWRFAGRLTLLRRSVTNLREARMQAMDLSERDRRSTAYRDIFGRPNVPDQLVLRGDSELAYPYRDDLPLIRGFLKNPHNREVVLTHPLDIRRQVASWLLLMLAGLSVVGWVVTKILGRDPLSGAPARVKPLPPRVAGAVILLMVGAIAWFFSMGHRVLGPVATGKVQLLFDSASNNDAEGVAEAARRGVYLDVRISQGMTALHVAARSGADGAARALLEAGARPDLLDGNDSTPLLWAIQLHHPDVAETLLTAGADVFAADANGRTALHLAAERGEAALLKRILEAGAEVDRPDAHGWTALFFAAASGNVGAVQVLLDAGADVRRKLPDGRTPADLVLHDSALRDRLRQSTG